MKEFSSMDIRPYQLMCIVCRLGAPADQEYHHSERLDEILAAVRANRHLPLTLRCNVDTIYQYQNPSRRFDTPEGELFNDKRDLDILQQLALVPGDTRVATDLFRKLFKAVTTCKNICGRGQDAAEQWRGCRLADSGNYERGRAKGPAAIIPDREPADKARAKAESVAAMMDAEELRIRPHHLMCMACFHAGKKHIEPIAEDNLCEAIEAMRENPEIPVRLVAGPCMICPPCNGYDTAGGLCDSGIAMGMRDQKKDLDVLEALGLKYGDVMPARELYRRLFERITSVVEICGYGDGIERSIEWHVCGGCSHPEDYTAARRAGMGIEGLKAGSAPGR